MSNIRIGDYLVSKGLITEEQLMKVLEKQKESQGSKRFGEVIIELGFISGSSDYSKLINPSFQSKAAKSIYNGIVSLFSTYRTGR